MQFRLPRSIEKENYSPLRGTMADHVYIYIYAHIYNIIYKYIT